ncbi:hypothetical protein [Gordonia bronchialis]|uniref:hypothetical protein n=1 Tax=Gordonia bronchialis TaxID=2054 RepID=UPI00242D1669|nr:hypothetical protein [Gordonia bronchialis]
MGDNEAMKKLINDQGLGLRLDREHVEPAVQAALENIDNFLNSGPYVPGMGGALGQSVDGTSATPIMDGKRAQAGEMRREQSLAFTNIHSMIDKAIQRTWDADHPHS